MNEKLPIFLCVVSLLIGAIAGVMFLSHEARGQGGGIIVDGEDDILMITNEHSAELANVTSVVTSRVFVEYRDFAFTCEPQRSDALLQAAANVTSRVIVEYADFIFGVSLGPNPMEIIPEFQSPIILSLLLILSTLTLAFAKCTHSSWRREKRAR
jgi:hypothetical protein